MATVQIPEGAMQHLEQLANAEVEKRVEALNRMSYPEPDVKILADYDFMLCRKCGRICTKREMEAALGPQGTGQACPCGSLKYSPFQMSWEHYTLPQVVRYARTHFTDAEIRGDYWYEMTEARVPLLRRLRLYLAFAWQLWQEGRA